MGLFNRFTDIINANLHNLLDKAEHPEKMIRLIISEMEETLFEVRSSAAKHIAEQKTLNRKINTTKSDISHWQTQAELALNKSRDDLARSALTQKYQCQEQLLKLNTESDLLADMLKTIQEDTQSLHNKLTEAKQRQKALLQRQNSAEVQLKVRKTIINSKVDDALAKFECYQQKIDRLEAQVESYEFTENKDLSAQISALAENDEVEAALVEMKKKVANG